jgi:hypothetical protein
VTVASPMRNGQESERDRLLAMLLMDEDRIYAQTAARRVPFAHHRPLRDELINGHARRRFPTGMVFTHEPCDFDDAHGLPVGGVTFAATAPRATRPRRRMPPACRWEPHVRRYSPARNPTSPSDAHRLPVGASRSPLRIPGRTSPSLVDLQVHVTKKAGPVPVCGAGGRDLGAVGRSRFLLG